MNGDIFILIRAILKHRKGNPENDLVWKSSWNWSLPSVGPWLLVSRFCFSFFFFPFFFFFLFFLLAQLLVLYLLHRHLSFYKAFCFLSFVLFFFSFTTAAVVDAIKRIFIFIKDDLHCIDTILGSHDLLFEYDWLQLSNIPKTNYATQTTFLIHQTTWISTNCAHEAKYLKFSCSGTYSGPTD